MGQASASAALNKWLKSKLGQEFTIYSRRLSMRDRLIVVDCPSEVIARSVVGLHKGFAIAKALVILKLFCLNG